MISDLNRHFQTSCTLNCSSMTMTSAGHFSRLLLFPSIPPDISNAWCEPADKFQRLSSYALSGRSELHQSRPYQKLWSTVEGISPLSAVRGGVLSDTCARFLLHGGLNSTEISHRDTRVNLTVAEAREWGLIM